MATLQTYTKNQLDSMLFYSSGDVLTVTSADGLETLISGIISSAQKDLKFSIHSPKSLANITSFSLTSALLNIRVSQGGYVAAAWNPSGTNFLTNSNFNSASVNKCDDYTIDIIISGKAAWKTSSNGTITNNQCIAVSCQNLQITLGSN